MSWHYTVTAKADSAETPIVTVVDNVVMITYPAGESPKIVHCAGPQSVDDEPLEVRD